MERNTSDTYWVRKADKVRKTAAKQLRYYAQACERYPSVRLPARFQEEVMARLEEYIPKLPRHPGGGRNIFNGLMPLLGMMAAVHVILRDAGWTPEQIGRLTYDAFAARFREMPGPARWMMRRAMVSPLLPLLTRSSNRAMRDSGRDDTFVLNYSFERRPAPCTTMRCTQCGMVEFMKNNDLTEMGVYCNTFDFAQADACGMGLVQPQCLGTGDRECGYRITRDPTDTCYPDNLVRMLSAPM